MPDFKTRIPLSAYLRDPFEFAQEELLGAYLCSSVGGVFTAGGKKEHGGKNNRIGGLYRQLRPGLPRIPEQADAPHSHNVPCRRLRICLLCLRNV